MKRFEFLKKNLAETSTQLIVSSGSNTISNLINRKRKVSWGSVGENTEGNTATISWIPGSATIISRIALQNHNFAAFNIIYNSVTTNVFTPAFSQAGLSASNTYYIFASTSINSIDINIWNTFPANTEKSCGEVIISDLKFELNTNPNFGAYQPQIYKKGMEQELSDGGIISVYLASKYRANIDLAYINTSTYENLKNIYEDRKEFIVVPFPENTFTTYWEGQAYQVNWLGNLSIDSFRSNARSTGYTGNINIAEVPD